MTRPRVAIVLEGALEQGRGPLARLHGLLPHLALRFDLTLVALGPPDAETAARAARHGVAIQVRSCRFTGWALDDAPAHAAAIAGAAVARGDALLVLGWELWDLARTLAPACRARGLPFALALHAVPLLNCPPRPSRSYALDVVRRLVAERDPAIRRYLLRHAAGVPPVLARIPLLCPNATVAWYLGRYFPRLRPIDARPGYGLDLAAIAAAPAGPPSDLAFMAKLVPEKGIYDLLAIVARVQRLRPGTRLRLIGAFEGAEEERRFAAACARTGLAPFVERTGWLSGAAKIAALKGARVFAYPARTSDSFCIAMAEAVACGLAVVAWDLPFTRAVYADAPVTRVPLGDRGGFARALAAALDSPQPDAAARAGFVARYDGWSAAAAAEARAWEAVIAGQTIAAGAAGTSPSSIASACQAKTVAQTLR